MRLKTKFVHSDIESGTTRLRRVFAWFPIVIGGDRIFLEYYEILEGYIVNEYIVQIDDAPKSIKAGSWVKLSKRLIN